MGRRGFEFVQFSVELFSLWKVNIDVDEVHVVLFVGDGLQFHFFVLLSLEQSFQLLVFGFQTFYFVVLVVKLSLNQLNLSLRLEHNCGLLLDEVAVKVKHFSLGLSILLHNFLV